MGHYLTTPPVVEQYFHDEAFIVEDFHPDRGWQPYAMRKRISPSWARKLQGEGVTAVALVPVSNPNRQPADFVVKEILRSR